jgi:hypothetical protein
VVRHYSSWYLTLLDLTFAPYCSDLITSLVCAKFAIVAVRRNLSVPWIKAFARLRHFELDSDNTMTSNKLAQFSNENYLSLETFRKSGQGVRTPVWFTESNGIVFIYSLASAGKVKRVRNNPTVRIAPCDFRGGLKGTWVDCTATLLDEEAAAEAHVLLTKKYGWMKRIGDLFSRWRKRSRVTIAIRPD